MAISINRVYQKVLAISNKEQRGYVSPQEFNLLADKAQLEIFENYFHSIKTAELKIKNQLKYSDEVELVEEKLHPFHVDEDAVTSTASLTLPADTFKVISITRSGNEVTQLNKNQILYTENNPLTKATISRSTFVREDDGVVTIHPAPTESTTFEVSYYKRPAQPKWTYIVHTASGKALYNNSAADAQDFTLHGSEEEHLVSRILMLAGVIIQRPDIQQAGIQDIQLTKQQQNS